jgi:uncharacterized protein
MKIAIIGSGISGLATAYLLNKEHDIELFEKNDYLGGHSNTANIKYNQKDINVDTGFIVFNFRTYPNLKALFELLNVRIDKSNMSFGIKDLDSKLEYNGDNLAGLFAQKKNIFNPKYLKMLFDIIKFNKASIKLIESKENIENITLYEFIKNLKLGTYFQDFYLFPMAAAIWSCPLELMKNYPAKTFLQFFYNHGLLTVTNQPQWYTVKGGSKEYVKKITKDFKTKIRLNCQIMEAKNDKNKVTLKDNKGQSYKFDHVIFASHTDQTYKIIKDLNSKEKKILSSIKYSNNKAVLHNDQNQMPKNKKAWASWIYLNSKSQKKVSLSYWMNNLQNIDAKYPLFVTLNPIEKIDKSKIFAQYNYEHPIFDQKAIHAQEKLAEIQGKRNIWYCGAWTKYGFHEDGLNSAINIAKEFDIEIPWKI